jgi:hypothetical protein
LIIWRIINVLKRTVLYGSSESPATGTMKHSAWTIWDRDMQFLQRALQLSKFLVLLLLFLLCYYWSKNWCTTCKLHFNAALKNRSVVLHGNCIYRNQQFINSSISGYIFSPTKCNLRKLWRHVTFLSVLNLQERIGYGLNEWGMEVWSRAEAVNIWFLHSI